VTRTRERHAAVHELLAAGHSPAAISRALGLDRQTVQRFAREPDVAKLLVKATSRETRLDPFKPWINHRWNEGITDAAALHAELQAQGWKGSAQAVRRYVRPFRQLAAAPLPAPAVPKARQITRWLLSRPASLDPGEHAQLEGIRARCPHINALAAHVTSFAEMMTNRTGEHQLEGWLAAVEADDQPHLHSFAAGIRRDQAAVTARAYPALQLRRGRGQRQPDQDAQTPDVRPRPLRPATQARHPPPRVNPITEFAPEPEKYRRTRGSGPRAPRRGNRLCSAAPPRPARCPPAAARR
jgi:Homeodomain-like domain